MRKSAPPNFEDQRKMGACSGAVPDKTFRTESRFADDSEQTPDVGNKTPAPLIVINSITLRFGTRLILNDFSIRIDAGEKITFTGPSGTGKTSILRCLQGFLVPEKGAIFIQGTQLNARTIWRLRRKMAFVQQEPEPGRGTVLEIMRRPFAYKANHTITFSTERAAALLDRMHLLPATLHQNIDRLSGGEKQRVALALALLLKREILLLDEPASALDRETAALMADILKNEFRGAVIAAVHHPENFDIGGRIIEIPYRKPEK